MKRTNLLITCCGLMSVFVLTSGCAMLQSPTEGHSIDPPPPVQIIQQQTATQHEAKKQLTLYLIDEHERVVPYSVSLPQSQRQASYVMQTLVDGAETGSNLSIPVSYRRPLPKGTALRSITHDDFRKSIRVDLSSEFLIYRHADERKMIECIVWSLTSLPNIKNIQLFVQGKPLREMPLDGLPLDEQLTRSFGINIKLPEASPIGVTKAHTESTAIRNEDGSISLIPITTFIPVSNSE